MYILYTPNNFSFKEKLMEEKWSEGMIKNHLWKYHYLFSHLVDTYYLKSYDSKYVPFYYAPHDVILKKIDGHGKQQRLSTRIMNDLKRWNIIKLNKQFNNDTSTATFTTQCEFKLVDEFIAPGWSVWSDTTVKQAYKQWQPNTPYLPRKRVLTGIYKQLADNLPAVTIDAVGARKFAYEALVNKMPLKNKKRGFILVTNRVMTPQIYSVWVSLIDAIERGDYSPCQDELKSGRFFSRLTSLPKILRPFLSINGKPLIEIDISNCQCLIFSMYLRELYTITGEAVPVDVATFISESENGVFYRNVQQLLDGDLMVAPSEFKISFFAKVFFSNGNRNYQWIKDFSVYYPHVYQHIAEYKRDNGYKALPTDLQYLESDIMLNHISKRLLDVGLTEFYTVHDAIYCTADIKETVEQVINDEFQAKGVTPHFK